MDLRGCGRGPAGAVRAFSTRRTRPVDGSWWMKLMPFGCSPPGNFLYRLAGSPNPFHQPLSLAPSLL